MSRRVLCVESQFASQYLAYDICSVAEHVWIDKADAETNEDYRQIIPYIAVVRRRDGKVLVYDRHGEEGRLHGLSSIGIGGHVDYPEDWQNGARRELLEEAGIPLELNCPLRPLGIIIKNDSIVDRVHLGLAFWIDVETAEPQSELKNACWLSLDEAANLNLELWSVELLAKLRKAVA